jgi:hypothetical protein
MQLKGSRLGPEEGFEKYKKEEEEEYLGFTSQPGPKRLEAIFLVMCDTSMNEL